MLILQYKVSLLLTDMVAAFVLFIFMLVFLCFLYCCRLSVKKDLYIRATLMGGSVAEWLACWTQAQKGPGTNRSRDAVG